MDAASRLLQISQSSESASLRVEAAIILTNDVLWSADFDGLMAIMGHVFGQNSTAMLLCRPVVKTVVLEMANASKFGPEQLECLWTFLLDRFKQQVGAYNAEETIVRERLADLLLNSNRYVEASKILSDLSITNQDVSSEKLKLIIRAAEILLNLEDVKGTEAQITRAVTYSNYCDMKKCPELQYQLHYLQANFADFSDQRLDAARRFIDLSKHCSNNDETQTLLSRGAACLLLSPAGPQRNRMILSLLKEPLVDEIPERKILELLINERLIQSSDLVNFQSSLKDHHLRLDSDGSTALEAAMRDNNICAIGSLFQSIHFSTLARLLQTTEDIAEKAAAKMINQKRLQNAFLDGENRYLKFQNKARNEITERNDRLSFLFQKIVEFENNL